MKNVWDRFRKWLIRKLGGYVEPAIIPSEKPTENAIIKTVVARPVMITQEERIACFDLLDVSGSYIAMEVQAGIAKRIALSLLKQGMIQFHETYDERKGEVVIRGRLLACAPPPDAQMDCAVDYGVPIH